MTYYLPHHLSVCISGGNALFLDIERDRYFRLAPERDAAVRALIEGGSISEEQLRALVRLGVVNEHSENANPLAPPAVISPSRSLIEHRDAERSHARWRIVPEIASLLALARVNLRLNGIASVLKSVAAHKGRITGHSAVADCVALAFDDTRRLVPLRPVCLADSLALLAFLFRRDIRADLVIGVKSRPFGAHCWIQKGDVILNGPLDHAVMFTPIRVV